MAVHGPLRVKAAARPGAGLQALPALPQALPQKGGPSSQDASRLLTRLFTSVKMVFPRKSDEPPCVRLAMFFYWTCQARSVPILSPVHYFIILFLFLDGLLWAGQ